MQMTKKMSLEIYKQMKRQKNPVTKKKSINSPMVRSSSKRRITLMIQMMTLTQEVKKGVVCLMKIGETNKWKSKEMKKLRKRNEMIMTKRKRKTAREKTQKA